MPEHVDDFCRRIQRELTAFHAKAWRRMDQPEWGETMDAGEWWARFKDHCEEMEDWL
jgi:hypothetical protein